MTKTFTLRNLLLILILGLSAGISVGQSVFANSITGTNPNTSNPYIIGQTNDPNITVSGIGRGTGISGTNANDRYNAMAWNNAVFDANDYFEFILSPNSGAKIDFISFVYTGQASGTGPATFVFRASVDGFTANIGTLAATGATISLSAPTYQGITSAITFRMYGWGATAMAGTFSINDFIFNGVVSPITPKYYRSQTSGDWNNINTWQFSPDNSTWSNSTLIPTSAEKTITIQAGHTLTASTSVSLDETIIAGTLQMLTGGLLTVNNEIGNDIDIMNNGVLQMLSTSPYSSSVVTGTSIINVQTGGKITIGDGSVAVGSGYETFATSASNVWNDASVFEWNSPTPFIFTGIYFPNALPGIIPNFTVSQVSGIIGGTGAITLNGLLVVNSNFALSGNGSKTLRDGITGTAQLTLNASSGGYTISSPAAIIGGTVSIILNENLRLTTGVTVPTGSSVNISGVAPNNIAKGTNGIFLVNGTADMNSTNISNTSGNISVDGTLKTSNPNGLYGTGATVINGIINLNTNSTIEYNANGPQNVQGSTLPSYYNVSFSGSGTKTLISNNDPAGTITVSGSAVFDAGNSTFGTAGTNLTMTGTSLYINGGGTTKPDAQGTYNLATGTTIEFALNSATIIRLGLSPINYANMVVSGTNVSNASTVTGIAFQNGGSFTVKTGSYFQISKYKWFHRQYFNSNK